MKIIGFNGNWQFPAQTEYASYAAAKEFEDATLKSSIYIAYPWATLIDAFQSANPKRWIHLQALLDSTSGLRGQGKIITVCQHIYALNYIDLFSFIGITDLFFPHKLTSVNSINGINIHPFPLFPVQASPPGFRSEKERKYLTSFVGAYNPSVYLTNVREKIFSMRDVDSRIKIIKREAWHYNRSVYKTQIQGEIGSYNELQREESDALEYRGLLADSYFSLCPSGSGPNSIRIFESMTYGSIPIVLNDSLDLTYLHDEIRACLSIFPDTEAGLQESVKYIRKVSEEDLQAINGKSKTLEKLRNTYTPPGYGDIIKKIIKSSANAAS